MDGIRVAHCTVERLMRQLGLRGAVRGKTRRTTISESGGHPASGPGQASVPGASSQPAVGGRSEYLRTGSGWVYAAFVIDVYSRMIVGWQLAACRHRCVGGRWGRDAAGGDLRRGAGLAVCGIMDGMYRLGNLSVPMFGLGWRVPRA